MSLRVQLPSPLVTTALDRGEHGATGWRLGCRCARCRAGLRRAAQVWWATAQLRGGRHDVASYTSAAPVRRRLEELRRAGWTGDRIAAAAQVSPSTISRISKPSTRWCSRIVARAVLGVEP
jgi:hypothetical protein